MDDEGKRGDAQTRALECAKRRSLVALVNRVSAGYRRSSSCPRHNLSPGRTSAWVTQRPLTNVPLVNPVTGAAPQMLEPLTFGPVAARG